MHWNGERTAAHLVQHVLDQLDLVGNLGSTEDSQERPLGALEHLGKVLELLLHQETGGSLRQLHADHGGVGSVGGTETAYQSTSYGDRQRYETIVEHNSRIVDVDCAERGQVLSELFDGFLVRYRLSFRP